MVAMNSWEEENPNSVGLISILSRVVSMLWIEIQFPAA